MKCNLRVRAGAGLQNKSRVLILGHDGEGIGRRNVGFDSEVQIEKRLQIDEEGPETSENPTQDDIHNITQRHTQLLAVIIYIRCLYII